MAKLPQAPSKFVIARHQVTRKFVVLDTGTWKPVSEHDKRRDAEKFVSAALAQEAGR